MKEPETGSTWAHLPVQALCTVLACTGLLGLLLQVFDPTFLPGINQNAARVAETAHREGRILIGSPFFLSALAWGQSILGSFLAGVISLALAWFVKDSPSVRIMALLMAIWVLLMGGDEMAALSETGFMVLTLFEGLAFYVLILRLGAHFPSAIGPDDLKARCASKGKPAGKFHLALVNPRVVWGLVPILVIIGFLPTISWVPGWVSLGVGSILQVGFVAGIYQTIRYLRTGYEIATPERRRAVVWILAGFSIWFWTILFWPLGIAIESFWKVAVEPLTEAIGSSGELFFILSIGFSIFHRGVFDPRLIIRTTTIWGATGTVLLFTLGGIEVTVSDLVLAQFGLPEGLGPWIAGGTAAAAFGPVRVRVRRRVDLFMEDRLPANVLATGPRGEAVVAFCDVAGYTRISQENEPTALTLVTVLQKAARRAVNRHQGRLVKTIGDAVLLEFRNVEGAIRGIRILLDSYKTTAEVLDLNPPPLRTGIHLGEVARSRDGDILGDTVNIAARLQGVAEPDQVVLSAAVKERLKEGEFDLEMLEPKILKNVEEPVICFELK